MIPPGAAARASFMKGITALRSRSMLKVERVKSPSSVYMNSSCEKSEEFMHTRQKSYPRPSDQKSISSARRFPSGDSFM